MKIVFLLIVLQLIPIYCLAKEKECMVRGDVLHWVADYCMYLSETDDFQNEKAQSCFEKEEAFKVEDTCENRMKYKRKLCNLPSVISFYTSVEACFEDQMFSGPAVRNGGV